VVRFVARLMRYVNTVIRPREMYYANSPRNASPPAAANLAVLHANSRGAFIEDELD